MEGNLAIIVYAKYKRCSILKIAEEAMQTTNNCMFNEQLL
jgi:hypothetical protein